MYRSLLGQKAKLKRVFITLILLCLVIIIFFVVVYQFIPIRITLVNGLSVSPNSSTLAFIGSWRKGIIPIVARDVFTIDIASRNLQMISNLGMLNGTVGSFSIDWDPKSNKIAYAVEGIHTNALWVANLDTSRRQKIISFDPPNFIAHPKFLAGIGLLFEKKMGVCNKSAIWLVSLDGTHKRKVVNEVDRGTLHPNWVLSPKCDKVYFICNGDIRVIKLNRIDEEPERILTSNLNINYLASMYPGGKEILFCDKKTGIWKMSIESGEKKNLFPGNTTYYMEDSYAIWSNNGKQIVFTYSTVKPFKSYMCVMNSDGSNVYILIKSSESFIHSLEWFNNKILFVINKNHIYTINIDGSDQRQIFPKI